MLAVAVFFAAPQYIFSSVLYGMSRHRIIAVLRLGEAVVNLVLSIILVQAVGIVGVALGTAIPSALIVVFVLPALAGPVIGVRMTTFYAQAYLRPAVAVLPFAVAALWVHEVHPARNLAVFFAQITGLLLIYVPCAFALVLNTNERRLIINRIRRTSSA